MELEITKGGGDRLVCGPKAKKKSEMGAPIHRTHTKKKSHHLLLLLLYNSFTAVTSTSVSRGGGGGDRTKSLLLLFHRMWPGHEKRPPFFNVAMGDNGLSGRRRYTHGGGGGPGPFGDEPTQLDIWEEGGNRMAGGRSARHRRCGSPVVSLCPPPFCGIA